MNTKSEKYFTTDCRPLSLGGIKVLPLEMYERDVERALEIPNNASLLIARLVYFKKIINDKHTLNMYTGKQLGVKLMDFYKENVLPKDLVETLMDMKSQANEVKIMDHGEYYKIYIEPYKKKLKDFDYDKSRIVKQLQRWVELFEQSAYFKKALNSNNGKQDI